MQIMRTLRYLFGVVIVVATFLASVVPSNQPSEPLPDHYIGHTEFRTDLPSGRVVSVYTMRAVVIKPDGTGRRVLAEELTREKGSWTQFVGW